MANASPSAEKPQLYTWDPNSNSGKPIFVLMEKVVDFDYHYVDLIEFEHHAPAYLAINPAGTVPTLIDQGRTFTESTPMCEYIDAAFPGDTLVPSDPGQRYAMRLWCHRTDVAAESLSVVGWHTSLGPMVRSKSPEELERLIARIPTEERRIAWRGASRQSFTDGQLADARAKVAAYLRELDEALRETGWLVGDAISLADLLAFANFYSQPLSNPDACREKDVPHYIDWLRRIYARPATLRSFGLARSLARRGLDVARMLGVNPERAPA